MQSHADEKILLAKKLAEKDQYQYDSEEKIKSLTAVILNYKSSVNLDDSIKERPKRRETWCPGVSNSREGRKCLQQSIMDDTLPVPPNKLTLDDPCHEMEDKNHSFHSFVTTRRKKTFPRMHCNDDDEEEEALPLMNEVDEFSSRQDLLEKIQNLEEDLQRSFQRETELTNRLSALVIQPIPLKIAKNFGESPDANSQSFGLEMTAMASPHYHVKFDRFDGPRISSDNIRGACRLSDIEEVTDEPGMNTATILQCSSESVMDNSGSDIFETDRFLAKIASLKALLDERSKKNEELQLKNHELVLQLQKLEQAVALGKENFQSAEKLRESGGFEKANLLLEAASKEQLMLQSRLESFEESNVCLEKKDEENRACIELLRLRLKSLEGDIDAFGALRLHTAEVEMELEAQKAENQVLKEDAASRELCTKGEVETADAETSITITDELLHPEEVPVEDSKLLSLNAELDVKGERVESFDRVDFVAINKALKLQLDQKIAELEQTKSLSESLVNVGSCRHQICVADDKIQCLEEQKRMDAETLSDLRMSLDSASSEIEKYYVQLHLLTEEKELLRLELQGRDSQTDTLKMTEMQNETDIDSHDQSIQTNFTELDRPRLTNGTDQQLRARASLWPSSDEDLLATELERLQCHAENVKKENEELKALLDSSQSNFECQVCQVAKKTRAEPRMQNLGEESVSLKKQQDDVLELHEQLHQANKQILQLVDQVETQEAKNWRLTDALDKQKESSACAAGELTRGGEFPELNQSGPVPSELTNDFEKQQTVLKDYQRQLYENIEAYELLLSEKNDLELVIENFKTEKVVDQEKLRQVSEEIMDLRDLHEFELLEKEIHVDQEVNVVRILSLKEVKTDAMFFFFFFFFFFPNFFFFFFFFLILNEKCFWD
uniref:Uncharacterized protein n=1 Tax=Eptatretus burgeri TaxID=7764 RepID=A0A8C4RC46_EPTBU